MHEHFCPTETAGDGTCVFFVLLQNDMTIEIYGHAANVSNNVFRWQQHAHREKIDSLKWGGGFPSFIQLINVTFKFRNISFLKLLLVYRYFV